MATGLFTSLFNALSDPKSYYAMQKEVNLKAVAQTFFNSFAGKTVFEAIILPQDIGQSVIYDGQRAVRVRIPEIHDLIIPEPCTFEDVGIRKRLLSLHPIAYPDNNNPNIDLADAEPDNNNSDMRVVECFFKDGPQSSGRLRGLTYRPKTFRNAGARGMDFACLFGDIPESPSEKFDNGGYNGMPGKDTPLIFGDGTLKPYRNFKGDPKKQDPSFKLGQCPNVFRESNPFKDLKRVDTTYFYVYTPEDVIKAIRMNTFPDYIKLTMFCYLSKEQPGGRFPNNNVAGIQTDLRMFPGTTLSDYDYQTCFKDSETWRAFAGFNTLDKGMKVFGMIVENKFKRWKKFKTTDSVETKASILADNYYQGWNIAATNAELRTIKATGSFTRKGKTYKRDWHAAKKKFVKSIKEYYALKGTQTVDPYFSVVPEEPGGQGPLLP